MRCEGRKIRATLFAILCVVAAVSLISLAPCELKAQTGRDAAAAKADMMARQRALWDLERMKGKLSKRPTAQRLAYEQIKEDFEQLQVVNYNLSGEGQTVLDYGQIKREAAEIKKRALRLKVNLSLPAWDKDEKSKKSVEELAPGNLKSAINILDAFVKSFIASAIFQQPNIVDVEISMKASRDLEGIIRLSEQIHKLAEADGKASGKN
jgi:hypothetical protein